MRNTARCSNTCVDALTRTIAVYCLEFNYHTITNEVAIDALVYALSIELLTANGIDATQPQANRLVFDTHAHWTFAQLALSDDSTYTITRL